MMAAEMKINILQIIMKHVQDEWIMWPLVLLAIVTITITLERLLIIFLDRRKLSPVAFLEAFMQALKKNNNDKWQSVLEMEQHLVKKDCIAGELMRTILTKFKDGVQKGMNPMQLKQWMKEAVDERAEIELPSLESHLGWLAIISNVSTLMGLLGTVYGMIGAFYSMAQSVGGVKADEMAGGIAIALIATLVGLFVAIPSLILYNWIKGVTEGYVVTLSEVTSSVIDKLTE